MKPLFPHWMAASLGVFIITSASCLSPMGIYATGATSAAFLDIPVGAGPASQGSAYTAMANNAYAPVWNPAGLGFLADGPEVTGTHLVYLDSLHYEFLSGVLPLGSGKQGIGFSAQYLGSGNIDERDDAGDSLGSYSSSFQAYSFAYGTRLTDNFTAGLTEKIIAEKISDASGHAFATDLGMMYRYSPEWSFAAATSNLGSSLALVSQSDPLPLNARAGVTFCPDALWRFALEGVYRKDGPGGARMGVEWKYGTLMALRTGYDTSHTKGLSAGSGLSAGLGLFFLGQEFSYAWVPYGDLGNSHYFSLVFRFGTPAQTRTMQPHLATTPRPQTEPAPTKGREDYDTIYDLLTTDEKRSLDRSRAAGTGGVSQ